MAQLAQDRSLGSAQHTSSYPADWYIEDDEKVSQSPDHQMAEFRLQSTLLAWQKRTNQQGLLIGCELACRWDPAHPRVGVDPDVFVVEKPPVDEETRRIRSLRTWESGHSPPILAIEIASDSRPKKDYKDSPERHDLLGTFELWVFDPELCGRSNTQPPVFLQIFQRETNNHLVRKYAGSGPYYSDALDAWVMVIDGDLVIADDQEGKSRWPTLDEAEQRRADEHAKRAEEQARLVQEERAAKERALQAKADAEARIAELEALLAKTRG